VNLAAANASEQLWRSADAHTFTAYTGNDSKTPFESLVNNMLAMNGSSSGELYVAAIVGPPVIHRVWPPERRADIGAAYSRSKFRARMEQVYGPVQDVTAY